MTSPSHRPRIRARMGHAAALLLVAALACTSRHEARDDDDDAVERPGAARATAGASSASSAAAAQSAAATGDASGSVNARSASTWTFDGANVGAPPAGFTFGRTGSGRPGAWVVRSASDAPSVPNVLAQEDSDRTDYRFPVAVADTPAYGDVSVSVRCKPVSGRVDQACGIVWRYRDENDYYLARANALEDNVNFYYVENGRRREVKGWSGRVATGAWHQLRADMRGDHVEVYFDGAKVIDARDARFAAPGRVGVWTKADSHTLFDDLTASPRGS